MKIVNRIDENNVFANNKILGSLIMLIIVVVFMVIILLLAEGYLRIFNPQPLIPRYVTDAPYGIRMNYPNINIWHTTPDYKINIRTNSRGIRADKEIFYEKPLGTKRIVALGDSYTLGYGVNKEDLYLTILEKKLNEVGYVVEVINLGVSGFSNAEELIALENEGIKYDPDLIVLAFYQNDLRENVISNLYAIENNELIKNNEEYLPKVRLRNRLYSSRTYRYLAGNSHLLYLIRHQLSEMIKKSMLKENEKKSTEILTKNRVLENRQRLAAKIIDRIYEITEHKGCSFVLLDIPAHDLSTDIPTNKMKHFNKMYFFDSGKILKQAPTGTLLNWKNSHGHWTPYSHKVVGENLVQFIIQNKLLD